MILLLLCLFRSHSHHNKLFGLQRKSAIPISRVNTFDTPGIYQATIQNGDQINVTFNNQSLRLFLFYSPDSSYEVDNIYIDGSIVEKAHHTNEQYGFAVDANDYSLFTFKHKEHNEKNQKSSFSNIKKHFLNHFHDDDDDDYRSKNLDITIYLLPRDLCTKDSIYQIGGYDMSLTSTPASSDNSMCLFAPQLNSATKYRINFGLQNENSNNCTLVSSLYTGIASPEKTINGFDDQYSYSSSKSLFIKYTFTSSQEKPNIKARFMKSMETTDEGNLYDIFCTAGAIEYCSNSVCSFNSALEANLDYNCLGFLPDDIIKWIGIIIGIVLLIIIIVLIGCCCCCVGCCVCAYNSTTKPKDNHLSSYNESSISTSATPTVYPAAQSPQQGVQGYYYINPQELQPGQTAVYAYNQQPTQQPPMYQQPVVYQHPSNQGKIDHQTPLLG